jgi:hypothetical protein
MTAAPGKPQKFTDHGSMQQATETHHCQYWQPVVELCVQHLFVFDSEKTWMKLSFPDLDKKHCPSIQREKDAMVAKLFLEINAYLTCIPAFDQFDSGCCTACKHHSVTLEPHTNPQSLVH